MSHRASGSVPLAAKLGKAAFASSALRHGAAGVWEGREFRRWEQGSTLSFRGAHIVRELDGSLSLLVGAANREVHYTAVPERGLQARMRSKGTRRG